MNFMFGLVEKAEIRMIGCAEFENYGWENDYRNKSV